MPQVNVNVSCPVHDSFRVQQIAGMFDVPLEERAVEHFDVEVPATDEPWQTGLIVGPSGSGKTTVARHAFSDQLDTSAEWAPDRAVVDCFDDLGAKQIVGLLTAVGFGSPPAWVKPYHVLSNGERFRCDLARALARAYRPLAIDARPPESTHRAPEVAGRHPLVVFDEFTSVVDRNVARATSAAIAKGIRHGHLPCRFVAVTCHYDVAEWLEPDWVLDMRTRTLRRRRLRRPRIVVAIQRCRRDAWQLFKRHHYLNGGLPAAARCYLATWLGEAVTFCATVPLIARRGHRRVARVVTLPDFQGLGIGMRVVEAVAELHRAEGLRINVTSSHPSLVSHCARSPLWRTIEVKKTGGSPSRRFSTYRTSVGRAVVSFEYRARGTDRLSGGATSSGKHPAE